MSTIAADSIQVNTFTTNSHISQDVVLNSEVTVNLLANVQNAVINLEFKLNGEYVTEGVSGALNISGQYAAGRISALTTLNISLANNYTVLGKYTKLIFSLDFLNGADTVVVNIDEMQNVQPPKGANNFVFESDTLDISSLYNPTAQTLTTDINVAPGLNANLIADGTVTNDDYQNIAGSSANLQLQIDALASGSTRFQAKAMATVNVDISNPDTDTYDGITLSNGDSLFLNPVDSIPFGYQTASNEGGIYTFNGIGVALTRVSNMDEWDEVVGSQVNILQGALWGGSTWNNLNVDGGTIDVTDITYKQIFTNLMIGTINSQTKSANGAVIIGANLYMQTADSDAPGLLSSAFYDLLNTASYMNINDTLALRAGDGSIQFGRIFSSYLTNGNRALISNGASIEESVTTSTEIAYVSGVLSPIQTQIQSRLASASNLADLANPATARTNLGLGTAAVLNTGTSTNNVVQYSATNSIGNGSTAFLGLANMASAVGSALSVGAGLQFASGSNYDGSTIRQINIDSAVVVTQSYLTSQIGAASGIAPLGSDSKIPSSYLPAIAIVETFVVNSQAAMLALTAQQGDVAVRTDLNQSFILTNNTPSVLASWQVLLTPTDSVLSVNGYTGIVSLTKSDIGLSNVENTALSTWAGSTNITTLGTIATGIWNGTTIGATKGGTGQSTYALGDILYSSAANTLSKLAGNTSTTKMSLVQTGAGGSISAAPSWQQLAASDLSNGVSGTGAIVLAASPSLVAPNIGAATGTSLNVSGSVIAAALIANNTISLGDNIGSGNRLGIVLGETLSLPRTLTLSTGDASRSLTISGNATISQDYSITASPQFAALVLSGSVPAYAAGKMFYDSTENSMCYYTGFSTVTQNIGFETWILVFNNSGSTILNGKAVYINGASGTNPTVALAQANSLAASIVAGLATMDIPNNSTGVITNLGAVRGLNTSGFSAGARLFLSATSAGDLVATAPASPNYQIPVAVCAVSDATQGKLIARIGTALLGTLTTTDTAVAKFNGTTGALQNSGVLISASNQMSGITFGFIDGAVNASAGWIINQVNTATRNFCGVSHQRSGVEKWFAGMNNDAVVLDSYVIRRNNSTTPFSISNAADVINLNGGIVTKVTVVSGTYTILVSDSYLAVNTSAARAITLPSAATAGAGATYFVYDATGSALTNNITISRGGTDTINNGLTSRSISAAYNGIRFISDGTSKWIAHTATAA